MADDDEASGLRIVKRGFEYGYTKIGEDQSYTQKTSWCLTPAGYESDPEMEGVHKIAFTCHTKQDSKVYKYVIIDSEKVTVFSEVRKQVLKQVSCSM